MARPPGRPDIPLRWQPTPDGRSRGTFTQFVRDYVAARSDGAGRNEVVAAARDHGNLFRMPASQKGALAVIGRLIRMGELIETGGRLHIARTRRGALRKKGR